MRLADLARSRVPGFARSGDTAAGCAVLFPMPEDRKFPPAARLLRWRERHHRGPSDFRARNASHQSLVHLPAARSAGAAAVVVSAVCGRRCRRLAPMGQAADGTRGSGRDPRARSGEPLCGGTFAPPARNGPAGRRPHRPASGRTVCALWTQPRRAGLFRDCPYITRAKPATTPRARRLRSARATLSARSAADPPNGGAGIHG